MNREFFCLKVFKIKYFIRDKTDSSIWLRFSCLLGVPRILRGWMESRNELLRPRLVHVFHSLAAIPSKRLVLRVVEVRDYLEFFF